MSSQKSTKRPRDSEALDHVRQAVETTSQAGEEFPQKRRRNNDVTGALAALVSLAGQLTSEQAEHLKRDTGTCQVEESGSQSFSYAMSCPC